MNSNQINPSNPRVYIEQPSQVTVNQKRDLLDRGIDAIQSGSTAVIFFCAIVGVASRPLVRRIVEKYTELVERQITAIESLTKVGEAATRHYQEFGDFEERINSTLINIKMGIDSANCKLDKYLD